MNNLSEINNKYPTTENTNQQWQQRKMSAMARGEANVAPVYIERGVNSELFGVEGKRYIDFGSGVAVVNTGCNPPEK